MSSEGEAFISGAGVSAIVWLAMLYFVICPWHQKHAIECGTASYSETTGKLVWHDCAAAPEPAPVPEPVPMENQ